MLKQTNGTALTVTDEEMLASGKELASTEGIFAAPEGAATVRAREDWRRPDGSSPMSDGAVQHRNRYKYTEAWQRALGA